MKNISTGFGLCVLGLGVALWPIMDRFAPSAREAHAGVPVAAVTAAVIAQAAPTITWYGITSYGYPYMDFGKRSITIARAWSDGKIETCENITETGDRYGNWQVRKVNLSAP